MMPSSSPRKWVFWLAILAMFVSFFACSCESTWYLLPSESCGLSKYPALSSQVQWPLRGCLRVHWTQSSNPQGVWVEGNKGIWVEITQSGELHSWQPDQNKFSPIPLSFQTPPQVQPKFQLFVFGRANQANQALQQQLCLGTPDAPPTMLGSYFDCLKAPEDICWFAWQLSAQTSPDKPLNTTESCQLQQRNPSTQEPTEPTESNPSEGPSPDASNPDNPPSEPSPPPDRTLPDGAVPELPPELTPDSISPVRCGNQLPCIETFAGPPTYQTGPAKHPWLNQAEGVAWFGNYLYVADTGNHRILRYDFRTDTVSIFAGTKVTGKSNGPGEQALFDTPTDVDVDPAGNIYVADSKNHMIRKITPAGFVSTLAGIGQPNFRDATNDQAYFYEPRAVLAIAVDHVLVADYANFCIRKIESGFVGTYAGRCKVRGFTDGDPATASLGPPVDIALTDEEELLILDVHAIRKFKKDKNLETIAGSASSQGFNDGPFKDARLYSPSGILFVSKNNIYIADTNNHILRRMSDKDLKTVAGQPGSQGYLEGPALSAQLNQPKRMAKDDKGNIYIADQVNSRIRIFDPKTNQLSTLIGDIIRGTRDGTRFTARFDNPVAIAINKAGEIFVSQGFNNQSGTERCIRKIDANGVVSIYAGEGAFGFRGGNLREARFTDISALAFAPNGELYIVDTGNHVIRKVDGNGQVVLVAGIPGQGGHVDGKGLTAKFNTPTGIAFHPSGDIYIADRSNHRIRKIDSSGNVTTFAGTGAIGTTNGKIPVISLNSPADLVIASDGSVYFTEATGHCVRKIDPEGNATTLAGKGTPGFEDGSPDTARFFYPQGIAIDSKGNLYIADTTNHRIRKVDPSGNVTTIVGPLLNTPDTPDHIDGPGNQARINTPQRLVLTPQGDLLLTENANHRIRKIYLPR